MNSVDVYDPRSDSHSGEPTSTVGVSKTALALALMWGIVTSLNLTKAVHIDDTAYLEIAVQILHDPLRPMSGMINWRDTAEPIYATNQPLAMSYLFAGAMYALGPSELVLHAIMAGFSLAAIIFFYLLARELIGGGALLLTAMFCLGPAFVPAQNLMTDIPATACWLAVFWAILCPTPAERIGRRYLFAAAITGIASLIKYTSLLLIPILALDMILRRRWRLLPVVGLPVLVVAAWSAFNYIDYGGIHLLSRRGHPVDAQTVVLKTAEWIIGLGAVSPFSIALVPAFARWNKLWVALEALLVWLAGFFFGVFRLENTGLVSALRACFFVNGWLVCRAVLWSIGDYRRKHSPAAARDDDVVNWMLWAWLLAPSLFVIVWAPFMATRHLLVALPAVLLIVGRSLRGERRGWLWAGALATASLGVLLGVSDWCFAEVYRAYAAKISEEWKGQGTIWYVGHWGWQWYARQEGMKQYDPGRTVLRAGDLVVVPQVAHSQPIARDHRALLERAARITVPSTAATVLRTMSREFSGGVYGFWISSLPWSISSAPLEEFDILRAVSDDGREM